MKYIIFLGDGMADQPLEALGQKTPLMVAAKPNMDRMARTGLAGMIRTVPHGLAPGSDTANMSVMGYDPHVYYTGRSPLEAISMSIPMQPGDISFRCNLVTLSDEADYAAKTMLDYSADEIGSDEAARLIEAVNSHLADNGIRFYPGKSYRHCMIWQGGPLDGILVPPHDILTREIRTYLPAGPGSDRILNMMSRSTAFLHDHPVNQARRKRGLNPANSIWIWGQGSKPQLPLLADKLGLRGSVISAVDLIYGLGICAGLHIVEVPGVTGNIHTNFKGKAEAAIAEFSRGQDYVYLHVEAPDECGHRAEIDNKVKAIERIDQDIIGPVWTWLEHNRSVTGEDYRMLVMPDHPTPLALRTHTSDPVPFALYSSDGIISRPADAYDESSCAKTGYFIEQGYRFFERFVQGNLRQA